MEKHTAFNVEFYETADGFSEIQQFLESIRSQAATSKDARIQFEQIVRYIELLQENGTNLPIQIVKHIDEELWELRPGNNRILFFYFDHGTYVLLHHFRKKTQKTPRSEINKAKAEIKDYKNRKQKQ